MPTHICCSINMPDLGIAALFHAFIAREILAFISGMSSKCVESEINHQSSSLQYTTAPCG